jgi:O-antigen/teichoic acid export membrane protein
VGTGRRTTVPTSVNSPHEDALDQPSRSDVAGASSDEPDATSLKRILGFLWGAQGLGLLVSAAQALIVAGLLGADTYGEAALVVGFPTLVYAFLNPQSEEAVTRFISEFRVDDADEGARAVVRLAYRIDVALTVLGFATTVVLFSMTASSFGLSTDFLGLVAVASVGVGAATTITTSRAILGALGRFHLLSGMKLGASLFGGVLAVGLTAVWQLDGFVASVAIGSLVAAIGYWCVASTLITRELGESKLRGLGALRGRVRPIVRFLFYTDLTTLSSVLVKHADLLVLGLYRPVGDVGVYRLARSLVSPLGAVQEPLQTVVYPRLALLGAQRRFTDFREALRTYHRSVGRWIGVLGLAGVPVLAFAPSVLLGEEYASAAGPALFLYVGALASVVGFWIRPGLLAIGAERELFVLSLVSGVLTLIGYFVLADPLGASGIAFSRAVFAGGLSTLVALRILLSRIHPTDKTTAPEHH